MSKAISEYSNEELLGSLSDEDLKQIAGISESPSNPPQRSDRLPLKSSQNNSNYSYGDAAADTGKTVINSLANLGENTINSVKSIPQIPNTVMQAILHPIVTGKAIGGAIGDKINQYNSMDKFANKVSSDPFGFSSDVVNSAMLAKGLINVAPEVGKIKVPMPKIYNDALINSTGQSAVSKIQGAIAPLREKYKAATEPFVNKPVDADTFQKALSAVPKEMQKDLSEKYGSLIVDNRGNPHTTVGNLQKMELGLKDDIQQPKYGQSINAASYNVAEAAKKIKQVRLEQYPEATQKSILELDKKFGPVINMTDFLLPKMSNRAGAINTKMLFNVFKNPSDAGTREYLSGLKGLGVDLGPEIKTLKGWVARQNAKNFLKGITGKVAEGATIGTVLRTGR